MSEFTEFTTSPSPSVAYFPRGLQSSGQIIQPENSDLNLSHQRTQEGMDPVIKPMQIVEYKPPGPSALIPPTSITVYQSIHDFHTDRVYGGVVVGHPIPARCLDPTRRPVVKATMPGANRRTILYHTSGALTVSKNKGTTKDGILSIGFDDIEFLEQFSKLSVVERRGAIIQAFHAAREARLQTSNELKDHIEVKPEIKKEEDFHGRISGVGSSNDMAFDGNAFDRASTIETMPRGGMPLSGMLNETVESIERGGRRFSRVDYSLRTLPYAYQRIFGGDGP